MADPHQHYLNTIGRFPLLTADQEIHLARDVQAWINNPDYPDGPRKVVSRGIRARDRLVQSNMRLVAHIARRYERRLIGSSYDYSDLLQDGNVGLLRAVEKFDPERGYKFSTYAYWWIKQSIHRGIEYRQRPIRIPSQIQSAINRSNKVTRELATKLGRMPTHAELAEGLGLNEKEFRHYLLMQSRQLQLDHESLQCDGRTLSDAVADPNSRDMDEIFDEVQLSQWRDQLDVAWACLRDDEKELLAMRYGLDGQPAMNYADMSKSTGLSRERMRQRVVEIHRKLRVYANSARVAVSLAAS